jgi:hypothetical protein
MTKAQKWFLLIAIVLGCIAGPVLVAQLQQSGGPGSSVSVTSLPALPAGANVIGHVIADSGSTTAVTSLPALPAGANVIGHVVADSGSTTAVTALPATPGGTNNIGLVRVLPSSCTQSTNFAGATSQVATGAGTTVTSTTTCVTFAYANNITNSAVTLRLADKAGTPVIWLGGNADFTIPPNSNVKIPIDGVTFTSGITAIAGTASAINLQINGVQ